MFVHYSKEVLMTYQVVLNNKFIFIESGNSKNQLKEGIQSFFQSYNSLPNKDLITYLESNGIDSKIISLNDFNIIREYEQGNYQVIAI